VGEALRQVDAVCAHAASEGHVLADQQFEAPAAGDSSETEGAGLGVRRAEAAVDNGAAPRQPLGDRLRIWGANRIGEEQQRGQGLPQPPPPR
jgi:hypothetical protein